MNVATMVALPVAWLLGTLLVSGVTDAADRRSGDGALRLALGALLGLGLTSVIFCALSLTVARPGVWSGVIEAALVAALVWRHPGRGSVAAAPAGTIWTWPQLLLASLGAQAALVAGEVAWRAWAAAPWGGWDGWAIWNLHARVLARAGTEWPAVLAAPPLSWTHPDYPRLVAAGVARVWAWTGGESPAAAGLVSAAFAAALLGVLVTGVNALRGRIAAAAGGLLLAGTPFFVTFATNQHADIPFAAYALAAVVCGVRGWLIPAALCAGLAAWTKNEGLLFAAVIGVVLPAVSPRRNTGVILSALAVGLAPVIAFKVALAPANDLVGPALGPRLAQLFDPARHGAILTALGRDLRQFGEWSLLPYFAMALAWLVWRRDRPVPRVVPVTVGLMAAGYYGIYLLSPHDLAWHLDTSLVRLLLQLWPLVIFGWSLTLPDDPAAPNLEGAGRFRLPLVAMANIAVAAGLLFVLSGQPASGELAVRRLGLDTVSLSLGDGWHPPERLGAQRWAWSRGDADVVIYADASHAVGPVTLRLALRSFGPRTLTLRAGERILWTAPVGDQVVSVVVPDLNLPPGVTLLRFTSDAPPQPESAAAGARALAFALYHPGLQ